jgi:hypothetical protein
MQVTLRSDDAPDVVINASETVGLQKLDRHIRTLQAAHRWLLRESRIIKERNAAQAKQQPGKPK